MFTFIMLRPLLVSVVYESNDEFTLFGFIEGPGLSSTPPNLVIGRVAMYKKTRTGYVNEREDRDATHWRHNLQTLDEIIM